MGSSPNVARCLFRRCAGALGLKQCLMQRFRRQFYYPFANSDSRYLKLNSV